MQGVSQLLGQLSKRCLTFPLPHASNATKFLRSAASPYTQTRLQSTNSFGHVTKHINQLSRANEAPQLTPQERWGIKSRHALENAIASPPADAYAGRSVKVMGNEGGLASALKSLNDVLVRNKIRQQVRSSARHEKKGVKRRRLQSERWRKQFANEVRKKVQLVMKIRDRGA